MRLDLLLTSARLDLLLTSARLDLLLTSDVAATRVPPRVLSVPEVEEAQFLTHYGGDTW